jgi:hypothetical protein
MSDWSHGAFAEMLFLCSFWHIESQNLPTFNLGRLFQTSKILQDQKCSRNLILRTLFQLEFWRYMAHLLTCFVWVTNEYPNQISSKSAHFPFWSHKHWTMNKSKKSNKFSKCLYISFFILKKRNVHAETIPKIYGTWCLKCTEPMGSYCTEK